MRLVDTLFSFLGRRGRRARGRLAYRVLLDLVALERSPTRR